MSDQQPGTATEPYEGKTEVPLGKMCDDPVVITQEFNEVRKRGFYDDVIHPSHYCLGRKLEPWAVIDDWGFDKDYYLASSLEYIARAGRKLYPGLSENESAIKDLNKAIQFIQRKIANLEAEE